MGRLELIMETDKVSIFSPKYDGESMTEFEKFMSSCSSLKYQQLKNDFSAIISIINKITDDCGARENLFRLEGGKIKAIPLCVQQRRNKRYGTLRLYCIRISEKILIIGNGGVKTVDKYQEDPVLAAFVDSLRVIEHNIFIECRKLRKEYEDFAAVKEIIENMTI